MTRGGTQENVVALESRRPGAQKALREVEDYWLALAKGRLMPLRSEVDPRALAGKLDRVFMLELVAPQQARFRVAGNRLSGLLGMDLRGMPLTALFHPAARDDLTDALEALFCEPARIAMRLDWGVAIPPAPARQAHLLLLPLRDDRTNKATRALGVLDWEGTVTPPQRFRIARQERRTLIGYAHAPEPARQPAPGKGAEQERKGPGPKRHPTLTLVT